MILEEGLRDVPSLHLQLEFETPTHASGGLEESKTQTSNYRK